MVIFKGSVSRDFRPPFFHDSYPSGPLINRLKYFRILFFRFLRDIWSLICPDCPFKGNQKPSKCWWTRDFFELCDRIFRRNRKRVRKYFSLFIRGPDWFEAWKKEVKISWHTPFNCLHFDVQAKVWKLSTFFSKSSKNKN